MTYTKQILKRLTFEIATFILLFSYLIKLTSLLTVFSSILNDCIIRKLDLFSFYKSRNAICIIFLKYTYASEL